MRLLCGENCMILVKLQTADYVVFDASLQIADYVVFDASIRCCVGISVLSSICGLGKIANRYRGYQPF